MDTLTFLKRVLPEHGVFTSANLTDQGMRHGFFETVEELAQAVTGISQRGGNAYYAVAAFQEKGKRTQENARVLKSLILDIDCGADKPYPSWREGLAALGAFITALSLPKPMIVFSGNGLHVYWVLTEELAPADWKPFGQALKEAATALGLEMDPVVPADSARVLRAVGTINRKGGNEVRLLLDADPVTPDQMRQALGRYIATHSAPPPRQATTSKLAQALVIEQEYPEANPEALLTKCAQLRWGVDNQKDASEPFWYAMIGVAAFCQDAEATAVAWSNQHPDYDYSKTIQKMENWKRAASGPTTCKKFKEERPSGCDKCKFSGKITTPASIGAQFVEVETVVGAPDTRAAETPVPKGFKRTASGIKQVIDGTDIDICPFDVYPTGYGRDEALGYETVRYHWNRQHVGWQELTLRQAYLTDSRIREFTTAIADQGIVLKTLKQTETFQFMMRSYMDKLREMRTMTNLHNSMGWKEDFKQFVHGDDLYRRNDDGTVTKEVIALASGTQRLGNDLFCTGGEAQTSIDFTSLLQTADMPGHMFVLGVSLAAPLLAFTGLNGVTISLAGPSGTGKTLGQLWAQSLWGDPQKLHFAAKFTQNSLYSRLGMYCNLPMTIDEATITSEKEIGDFLYMVTQGRDKARLDRNAEERKTKSWALPVIVSTNIPLTVKLAALSGATNAQMMRLLEVSFDPHKIFTSSTTAGRKIFQIITNNYGWVGPKFVQYLLALGPDAVKTLIDDAMAKFAAKYHTDFSGEERYWEIIIVLADLASRIATEQGWFKFDYERGTRWVLEQTGSIRRSLSANKMDSYDILSEYLNENVRTALTVMHTIGRPAVPLLNRMPQGEVRVRYDVMRKSHTGVFDHGTVTIDRTHFRQWMAVNTVDYRQLMKDFEAEGIIVPLKSGKAYLGKGTDIKMGQAYAISLNLNHPRLQGILEEADQAFDTQTLGQLKVV